MRSKFLSTLALTATLAASPAALDAAPDQTLGMAIMSATVADGALAAGSGVVSVDSPSTGNWDIKFKRDLEGCTCTASFGRHTGFISTGAENFISSNCPSFAGNNVRVVMLLGGAFQNLPFQLIVFCPK